MVLLLPPLRRQRLEPKKIRMPNKKPTEQILEHLLEAIGPCTELLFKEVGTTLEATKERDPSLAATLGHSARVGAHLMAIGRYLDKEAERRAVFEQLVVDAQRSTARRLAEIEAALGLPGP